MTSTNVPMVSKAMFNALKNNPPMLAYRFLATIYDARKPVPPSAQRSQRASTPRHSVYGRITVRLLRC
jgi:hypothetical protein